MPSAEPTPNYHPNGKEPAAPCRSCVDFQSWSKEQRKSLITTSSAAVAKSSSEVGHRKADSQEDRTAGGTPPGCPLDRDKLGQHTWGLLHTMAAYYPTTPSETDERNVRTFFTSLSVLYPCAHCAKDFQQELKEMPPETKSRHTLSQWLCRIHNRVNVKLDKPEFDCARVNERWRDGWLDGSCD